MTRGFRIVRLHRLDASNGSWLESGCRFVECLSAGAIGDVDATHITIAPGRRTQPHFHRRSRCFVFVVDGCGVAHLGGRRRRVALNDFVLIQPGVVHAFEALDEPLTLLAIHGPALVRGDSGCDIEFDSKGPKR